MGDTYKNYTACFSFLVKLENLTSLLSCVLRVDSPSNGDAEGSSGGGGGGGIGGCEVGDKGSGDQRSR